MIFRKLALFLLKRMNVNINIRNPWSNQSIFLNTFLHKGYWFHGIRREYETMMRFGELVKPEMTVIEVGGHIGYITQYFSKLVGSSGSVHVFEPGSNNLPYIRRNISGFSNVFLIEKAVSDVVGFLTFYEENLTGQNNSLVKDFEGFKVNNLNALGTAQTFEKQVEATTIDKIFSDIEIDFIKIDIEGGEWPALKGALECIKKFQPVLMVEIQKNEVEIFNFLSDLKYSMVLPSGEFVSSPQELSGNVFFVPETVAV